MIRTAVLAAVLALVAAPALAQSPDAALRGRVSGISFFTRATYL